MGKNNINLTKSIVQVFKFGLVGLLNTMVTYILYIILLNKFQYSLAYSISYVVGIVVSYFFNTFFVFKQPITIDRFLKFPIVYLVQYLLNLLLMFVFVNKLFMNEKIVLLMSIVITFPITFLISRYVLKSAKKQ